CPFTVELSDDIESTLWAKFVMLATNAGMTSLARQPVGVVYKDPDIASMRVVADHIRSCAFLITDGVIPSNEGRGYVLRRIIRRAARHGSKLGLTEPFFHKLVTPLVQEMGEAYPELGRAQAQVEKVLHQEENRFAETLQLGLGHLEEAIKHGKGRAIAGEDIFRLYDTYGFPVDLTADIARERNLKLDMDGFDKAMAEQRERARAASKFEMDAMTFPEVEEVTEFFGYEELIGTATVKAIYSDGQLVNQLGAGETGGVILDSTPFYAESGGQVGDRGDISSDGMRFDVHDTKKQTRAHIHLGKVLEGAIRVGQSVTARVNSEMRMDTVRNHSATHLLHAALRAVLGEHVVQKGSLVAPDRLRFDFSHDQPLTEEELWKIESMVNQVILRNFPTRVEVMPLDKALESGAMSLFGEKYEAEVRVLTIGGNFSVELCGGTHVKRSGDIGLFKIINETGIAAGIRRIEAVSGYASMNLVNHYDRSLNGIAQQLKVDRDNVEPRLQQLLDKNRKLEKELEQFKSKLASSVGDDMAGQAVDVNGIKVIARHLENADPKTLRDTVDQLKNKLGSAALVLATVKDTKVSLVAGVTKDATASIKAGELVNFVAQQVGGKGGGRPDMAQAGGNDPAQLDAALAGVEDWVRERLSG
ncbi:MAG: alanine--tRNA ligase, partial [Thiotrichales bacterium]|nr:alanine--tRNA ligase [Thiotrichales bacterium]